MRLDLVGLVLLLFLIVFMILNELKKPYVFKGIMFYNTGKVQGFYFAWERDGVTFLSTAYLSVHQNNESEFVTVYAIPLPRLDPILCQASGLLSSKKPYKPYKVCTYTLKQLLRDKNYVLTAEPTRAPYIQWYLKI